jgi:rRNA maturation endonuclease Nob1
MNYCCKELEGCKVITQEDSGSWNIMGCCYHCYVAENIKFCPFCGAPLATTTAKASAG